MANTRKLRRRLRGTARMLVEPRDSGETGQPGRADACKAPPIVLLHGFGTSSCVLRPMARYLERRLRRPVLRLHLGGALPLHLGDVRATARSVQTQIEQWAMEADIPYVDVVGHSLGGLVATYLLKVLDRGQRVRRVVTLGTPHGGTWAALPGALVLGAFSTAIWQMIPGSPLLRELRDAPVPPDSELIALASDGDALVPISRAPAIAAPGTSQICIPGIGHVEYLTSRTAFRAVLGTLAT